MAQSRAGSVLETVLGTAVGYVVAVLSQVLIFPWFGIHVPLHTNFLIGLYFTVISLARGYCVRRLFVRFLRG